MLKEVRKAANGLRWPRWALVVVFATACVVPPPAGTPAPPRVEILMNDSRATRYGSSTEDVLSHPKVTEKVRLLFGRDWSTDPQHRRVTSAAAPDFFAKSFSPRVLRIGEWEYIAASGCMPKACLTHRGLLLIRADGEQLLARLDEGGFTHYYAFGAGMPMTPRDQLLIDAAWRALERTAWDAVR